MLCLIFEEVLLLKNQLKKYIKWKSWKYMSDIIISLIYIYVMLTLLLRIQKGRGKPRFFYLKPENVRQHISKVVVCRYLGYVNVT